MKRTLFCIFVLAFCASLSAAQTAQTRVHQQGTIVRMRMTDCLGATRGFMAIMSGGVNAGPELFCPEYVLVADKVVYVISGKNSKPLIPLADVTPFRLQKNQMLIRVDDAAKESRFHRPWCCGQSGIAIRCWKRRRPDSRRAITWT